VCRALYMWLRSLIADCGGWLVTRCQMPIAGIARKQSARAREVSLDAEPRAAVWGLMSHLNGVAGGYPRGPRVGRLQLDGRLLLLRHVRHAQRPRRRRHRRPP